jgi:hypothetical protein
MPTFVSARVIAARRATEERGDRARDCTGAVASIVQHETLDSAVKMKPCLTFPVATPVYRRVVAILVAFDLLLIGLHIVLSAAVTAGWLGAVPEGLRITQDHSLPETFNYAKWAVTVACLAAAFRRTRLPLFASLATVFLIVLLDDTLMIHEQVGDRLRTLTGWDQSGELVSFAGVAVISLLILIPGLLDLPRAIRPQAVRFIGVLVALAVCSVVIDFAHALVDYSLAVQSNRLAGLVEDGGEMLLASVATAYAVAAWRWASGPASKLALSPRAGPRQVRGNGRSCRSEPDP